MKTIYRSTCALTGNSVRLVEDRGAYAVVTAGESIGCGFELSRALAVFHSVAAPRSTVRVARMLRAARAAAVLACCALLPSVASAQDAPKVRKPTVCAIGEAFATSKAKGFACYDNPKRVRVFASWTTVQFVDSDGKPARYTLGW